MLQGIPVYVTGLFLATTIATLLFVGLAVKKAAAANNMVSVRFTGILLLAWLILQGFLSLIGFYDDNMSLPPKMITAVLPALLFILYLFTSQKGKRFIDSLPLSTLTWLQSVRVPVEIVLYWLMLEKTIPQLMTFEGRNFDILAGITAPLTGYLYFVKQTLPPKVLLVWNIACLLLVLNIVIHAVLAVETPIQQFAFEQPNRAVLKFPFIWLPSFIVPVVIFSHIVSIRQLVKKQKT